MSSTTMVLLESPLSPSSASKHVTAKSVATESSAVLLDNPARRTTP